MTPVPYLFFKGNCADALTTYADIFGGTIGMTMKAGDMPDIPVAEDKKDWIAHGEIAVGDGKLMLSDDVFEQSQAMAGAAVMMSYATTAEAAAVFGKLADGGQITMPFEPTFWSAGFGTVTDRFGINWMIGSDEQVG